MKKLKLLILFFMIALFLSAQKSGNTLYNGIILPDEWPPHIDELTREPMPVPYLEDPPEVIPIDVGRQLFVDDFLIDESTLERTFHQPDYCEQNPVIKSDKPWENQSRGLFAAPFSGGAWFDPADNLFKMWYTGGYMATTCYSTSKDGIHWKKPELDVNKGTNIVLEPTNNGYKYFDSNTIWLDHNAKNPEEKFKYFATEGENGSWRMVYRVSADGIHWSNPKLRPLISDDRTTAFYNPFRDVWVLSQRISGEPVGRARSYLEAPTAIDLMEAITPNKYAVVNDVKIPVAQGCSVLWTNADDLDPRHTDPKYAESAPQLYNLDVAPYESIMLGQFSIWQGPKNNICKKLHLQKRNDILLGFSRDGFHWDRPCRERFISCTWDEQDWRYGNVQSCAGGPLVVGDKLYFYFSGRAKQRGDDWNEDIATGLAILRRDGFASMDAGSNTETLTTRPITFKGNHLFVNVDCPGGELKAEVLDKDGKVIEPFTLANCEPVSVDKTLVQVNWGKVGDLAALTGKPVRFRFHMSNGSLYAFWVSPDKSGASHGYVGAGGPGFNGPIDLVGSSIK